MSHCRSLQRGVTWSERCFRRFILETVYRWLKKGEHGGWQLGRSYCSHLGEKPEKALAPHSSTLAWKIPWTGSLVGCRPWGREESDTTERLHFHFSLSCVGDGNGNPLQCSCLENRRDGEPGGLPSMGFQSWTQLKRLSSSSSRWEAIFATWTWQVVVGREKREMLEAEVLRHNLYTIDLSPLFLFYSSKALLNW